MGFQNEIRFHLFSTEIQWRKNTATKQSFIFYGQLNIEYKHGCKIELSCFFFSNMSLQSLISVDWCLFILFDYFLFTIFYVPSRMILRWIIWSWCHTEICSVPVDVSGHAKVTNLGHPPWTFASQKTIPGSNIPVKNKE